MVKLSIKNLGYCLLFSLIFVMLYIIYNIMNKPMREGVVFTPYDNAKLFTKPWSNFCIPPPPSCDKNLLERPASIGSPPIGCHCKGVGNAGNLDTDCQNIDYNHFY